MKSGPFSRLWQAGLVSSTGDWVGILATLSLAEELAGGSGIVLALVSRILPGLFFAAAGGVIADRVNRKYAMITVEVGRAALVFSLVFARTIQYLVLVNLALEALTLVFQPAKEASVPMLVRKNELVQANSLSLSAAYGTFPLGAAIFLLVAPFGPHFTMWGHISGESGHEALAFLVDSFTYMASAAFIFTLPIGRRYLPEERRRRGRLNLIAPLRDLRDGVVYVATHRRVRPVVLAFTSALAAGGIVVVLGKPYSQDVLNAGDAGFPALLTAFGVGAGLGIVLVTIFGTRLQHKDISFSFALLITGFALGAVGLIKTIFGGVGWILVMGMGTGAAYVLGFAHLHEQATDEVRGRTFAALFSLLRIGLLTSMAVALPLAAVLDGRLPGLLAEGMRVVLLVGGGMIFFSGMMALWRVRKMLVELGHIERRTVFEAATDAFRVYRRSVAGESVNNDEEPAELAAGPVASAEETIVEIAEEEDSEG
jgi:dTMP kinase